MKNGPHVMNGDCVYCQDSKRRTEYKIFDNNGQLAGKLCYQCFEFLFKEDENGN